eukprot:8363784-Pyramimonas_sp.AAC.1
MQASRATREPTLHPRAICRLREMALHLAQESLQHARRKLFVSLWGQSTAETRSPGQLCRCPAAPSINNM